MLRVIGVDSFTLYDKCKFRDLGIGQLYDSQCKLGLCIKTGDCSAYSLDRGVENLSCHPNWDCIRVDAVIKYRKRKVSKK